MGETYSTHGREYKSLKYFGRNRGGERTFGRPTCGWKDSTWFPRKVLKKREIRIIIQNK
jgi:hypothetical protein